MSVEECEKTIKADLCQVSYWKVILTEWCVLAARNRRILPSALRILWRFLYEADKEKVGEGGTNQHC